MAEYCRRLGEDVRREDLPRLVFSGGESRYRSVWLALMRDSFLNICHKIRAAVDEVDPSVRVGFCSGYTSWDLEGATAQEISRALAGPNTLPFLRFTGAPYWVGSRRFDRQTLQTVIETTRMQYAWCKNSGIEVFTEVDSYPRERFHTPVAYTETFDLATRVSDDMANLKYMYEYTCQPDYERGYVDTHLRHLPLYREIDEVFGNKDAVGIRVYEHQRKLEGFDLPAFPDGEYTPRHNAEREIMRMTLFSSAQKLLTSSALPTTYEGDGICGIAFGENAKYLPAKALSHGLILDAKAAQILQAQGVDVGLVTAETIPNPGMEIFDDGSGPNTQIFDTATVCRLTLKDGAEVLSRFLPLDYYSENPGIPAAYRYENAAGQRFLVYAFVGESQKDSSSLFWSYCRGIQIANQVPWLSRGVALPFLAHRQPHLYAIAKADKTRRAVAYFNCQPDRISDMIVTLSAPAKKVRFLHCEGEQVDATTLKIHLIQPFGFAAVEVE